MRTASLVKALVLSAAVTIAAAGCGNPVKKLAKNDLAMALKDAGWILLPIPDSNYQPSVVIYYPQDAQSPRYVGSLASCGVPESLLEGKKGTSPALSTSDQLDLDINLSLTYLNAKVEPAFTRSRTSKIDIRQQGSTVLDLIAIDVWRTAPENAGKFNSICNKYFAQDGYYLITEGWRVDQGTITYYTKKGFGVTVPDITVDTALQAGGNTNIKSVQDGKATFSSTSYLAIRGAVPLLGGLRVLGPDQQAKQNADGRLAASFAQR